MSPTAERSKTQDSTRDAMKNAESRATLQQMVLGHVEYNENQKLLVTSSSTFHLLGHLCSPLTTQVDYNIDPFTFFVDQGSTSPLIARWWALGSKARNRHLPASAW